MLRVLVQCPRSANAGNAAADDCDFHRGRDTGGFSGGLRREVIVR